MEQRDLEMLSWSVLRNVNELLQYVEQCSRAMRRLASIDESMGDVDPRLINEFYQLADGLVDVWLDHPQGEPLRGELTPSTFKDVLDRNVLLSETTNNKE
jgi:hypothetical protein